ncbi:hypothetical protein [Paenibacillus periandrae]|uniref:hypothetical protein n=1 Tax=Paenibacillus periandrae TaxID=1761741 RepID=UPI001F08A27C|nr:hypothetical protein [Paenibacillus periandrae]
MKKTPFAFVRRVPKSNEHVLYTVNGTGVSEKIPFSEAAGRAKDFIKQGGLLSGCKELIEALLTHSKSTVTQM